MAPAPPRPTAIQTRLNILVQRQHRQGRLRAVRSYLADLPAGEAYIDIAMMIDLDALRALEATGSKRAMVSTSAAETFA